MKVFYYTGGFTHTLNKELYRNPPENVTFIPSTRDLVEGEVKKDIISSKSWYYPHICSLKKHAVDVLELLKIPKIHYISNVWGDLIHSCQYLLLNKMPWVLDFEDLSSLVWYRHRILDFMPSRRAVEKMLEGGYCRKIIPWTEAAKNSMLNGLNTEKFREKIEVVYPFISPKKIEGHEKKSGKVRMLFIGTAFYPKGGVEVLRVFELLDKKYDIELTMISNTPPSVVDAYKKYENIRFLSRVLQDVLEENYLTSDIFVLPFHTDTFGFVLLEAMSYGLPCVSTDQFATPEIISDGETGYIIPNSISRFDDRYLPQFQPIFDFVSDFQHPMMKVLRNPPKEYVQVLSEKLGELIGDDKLRRKMSSAAKKEVMEGRFSVKEGRKKLKRVYEEAYSP